MEKRNDLEDKTKCPQRGKKNKNKNLRCRTQSQSNNFLGVELSLNQGSGQCVRAQLNFRAVQQK